jgi:hypothetical protein
MQHAAIQIMNQTSFFRSERRETPTLEKGYHAQVFMTDDTRVRERCCFLVSRLNMQQEAKRMSGKSMLTISLTANSALFFDAACLLNLH